VGFRLHPLTGSNTYRLFFLKPNSICLAGRNLVADLRDVRERVADKSKARREPVLRLYVADVTSDVCDLTCIDMTWVESVLDLSRHVEIDLARFRPGFRHEKF